MSMNLRKGRRGLAALVAFAMVVTTLMVAIIPMSVFAADAKIVTPNGNLVKDSSFEGVNGNNKSDVWEMKMESVSTGWFGSFISGASRTGKQAETCWSGDTFVLSAKQNIGKVAAGKYDASAWISIGRADYEYAKVTVKNGETVLGEADLGAVGKNDYEGYRQVRADAIVIPEGANISIEVSVKGGKTPEDKAFEKVNGYARIDDVCFEKTIPTTNLVKDPSFEAVNGNNKSDVWEMKMESVSTGWFGAFVSGASRVGKQAETCWSGDTFVLSAKQNIGKVAAGKYDASAWISIGRADYEHAKVTVKNGDKVIGEADLGAAGKNDYEGYRQVRADAIVIPEGANISIEVSVKGGKTPEDKAFEKVNGYARIDDVCLEKTLPTTNLVKDPSFEGVNGNNKSDVWEMKMDSVSTGWFGSFISGASNTGKQAETCWSGDTFTLSAKQNIGKVPAGKYEASAFISIGRADYEYAKVTVKNGDKILAEADLGAAGKNDYEAYRQIKAEAIVVPEGANVSIEVSVKGGKTPEDKAFEKVNGYARIDDVYFGIPSKAVAGSTGPVLTAELQKIKDYQTYLIEALGKDKINEAQVQNIGERLFNLGEELTALSTSKMSDKDKKVAIWMSKLTLFAAADLIKKNPDYTTELSIIENSENVIIGASNLSKSLAGSKDRIIYLVSVMEAVNHFSKVVKSKDNLEIVAASAGDVFAVVIEGAAKVKAVDTKIYLVGTVVIASKANAISATIKTPSLKKDAVNMITDVRKILKSAK